MRASHQLCDRTLIEITAQTIVQGLSDEERAQSKAELDTQEKRQRFAENLQNVFAPVLRHHPASAQAYFSQAVSAKLYLILDYQAKT